MEKEEAVYIYQYGNRTEGILRSSVRAAQMRRQKPVYDGCAARKKPIYDVRMDCPETEEIEYLDEYYGEAELLEEYQEEAESELLEEYADGEQEAPARRKAPVIAGAACLVVLLLAGAGFAYYLLPSYCVKEAVTIEAGETCPPVSAFLEWENDKAVIVSGIEEGAVLDHVQDYELTISLYHQEITTILRVADTVPPVVETLDKTIMLGEEFEAQDFVKSVSDITACDISFGAEPDVQGAGSYTIHLLAEDEGGNITEAEAKLEVLQDVTPPVIEGVEEITVIAGDSVSYKKNVTVTDDYDTAVKLTVDNSEVDLDTPGDYTVIYRAVDKYGNEAEVETVLHVKAVKTEYVSAGIPMTEEAVNAKADELLASITNESMTQYEIIKAIYDWCNTKIAYKDGAPKDSWVEGAYCGLVRKKGDCYTYAMTAKCLLNRAGITNMDIERIRVGNGMHFWNLVDIGEGWHHFDTCRRGDGATFFYLTDAELMDYSEKHKSASYPDGSHNYDRSLYPEIP